MNERIKQLIEKATKIVEPNDPDYRHEIFDKEKFAELIVQECIDAVMSGDRHRREYFAEKIKQRFGMSDYED